VAAESAAAKARAETVCIPYAFVPGLDINSRAYHRAVQITTGVKHSHFSATSPEDGIYIPFLSGRVLSLTLFL
jgi:hypothetical protein